MNTELSKRIKEIALELVAQKSIVETDDEVTMSDKVYEIMSRMDYYKKYPEKLYFVPAKNDKWNRKIVVAVMNGEEAKRQDCSLHRTYRYCRYFRLRQPGRICYQTGRTHRKTERSFFNSGSKR